MSENTRKTWFTPRKKAILVVLASLILAALIFHLGMSFEAEHFEFEYRSGYGFPAEGTIGPFGIPLPFPHEFIESNHGTVGTISTIHFPIIQITNRVGNQQSILVSSSTSFDNEGTSTLSVGETIVVVGQPDQQGHIVAQFIRCSPGYGSN